MTFKGTNSAEVSQFAKSTSDGRTECLYRASALQ